MKASLLTDNFQGTTILLLLAIITTSFIVHTRKLDINTEKSDLIIPTQLGWEATFTLIVASLSANIFHQGYWTRVYSARSNKELIKATILGSIFTLPVMLLIGFTGILSVWLNLASQNDSLAFFKICLQLPSWINVFILILATAFICSSVDTLQNGLAATILNDIVFHKVSLNTARVISALVNIPILFLAAKGYDVLTLFLIADLVAAIVVVPVLIGLLQGEIKNVDETLTSDTLQKGLRRNSTIPNTTIPVTDTPSLSSPNLTNGLDFCIGVVGGILSVILFGTIYHKSLHEGVMLLTLPNGLTASGESVGAFFFAPFGSAVFMLGSWFIRRSFVTEGKSVDGKLRLFNGSLVFY
jgi:hypothetical protein